jgi:hypothetical protein
MESEDHQREDTRRHDPDRQGVDGEEISLDWGIESTELNDKNCGIPFRFNQIILFDDSPRTSLNILRDKMQ